MEYVILKMKPRTHKPQIALLLAIHKLKVSEEQRKASIDTHEPLLAFALSCGMYSSPAVRIYTAKGVKEELLDASNIRTQVMSESVFFLNVESIFNSSIIWLSYKT
ncbi:unnamed protein product [Brassica oleracea]